MKPLRSIAFGAAVLIGMWGHAAHAEDLGAIGPTYAITEPNLLAFIEQRLREKERSGEGQQIRLGDRIGRADGPEVFGVGCVAPRPDEYRSTEDDRPEGLHRPLR